MALTRSQLEEPLCDKLLNLDQSIERYEILLLISKYNIGRLPVDHIFLHDMTEEDYEMMNIFDYRERDFAMVPIGERNEVDINRGHVYPDDADEALWSVETGIRDLDLAFSPSSTYSEGSPSLPSVGGESISDGPPLSLLCEDSCEKYSDVWFRRHEHMSEGGVREEKKEGFDEENFQDPTSYIFATLEFSKKELIGVLENAKYWGSDATAQPGAASNSSGLEETRGFRAAGEGDGRGRD
jgi:hypothetical protein